MLQPRDIHTHRRKSRLHRVANFWAIFIVAIFVGSNQYCSAQVTENEFAAVQPTKALRSDGSETPSTIDNGRALGFGLYMMDSNNNGDEARYNLATRIMSNGVEVIVAGDKSTLPGEPNVLRILPSSHYKQTTMPASTLKGDHMVMMLPDNLEIDELSSSLYDLNKFVTRTCLTTYTFLTTYLQDGTTTVESREKVISNTATEERNLLKISPTPTAGLTFTQTPKLAIGTFPTTYTYLNTIFDGDQPIVLTSKHTVTNTITAPDDYLSLLQPSESVTAIHDTNTYYSTVALTKTIHDDDQTKLISTDTVFTQIVITESLPSKMTSVMTSYVAFDVDDPLSNDLKDLATTDVVKTYYVTYTYLNTLLDNGSMIVRTNVSTSSDIVTEKLYLYSKRTEAVQATTPPHVIDSKPSKPFDSINIYATKTYLTTFTYFTTLLQVNSNERHGSSTVVDSHTNIVENVITESIPNSLFPTESLSSYYSAVQTAKNPNGIVTLATLLEGQTLEVTAVAPSETIKMSSTTKFVDKLVEENVDENIIPDDASAEAQPATSNTNGGLQNNKIEKIDNPVSDLIGSFNLNSLTAFGPMFNALTGLIQNNFAKNSNDRNTTIVRHVRNGTTTIKDEKGESIVPAALNDISGRNPIYIPVGGIGDEDIESAESQNIQLPQLNSFVPPSPPSVKWINDNGKQELVIGKPSPLLSGIAISPGEVITANSDVIIGRPTVGVSPRIPLHSDLDDKLFLDPPPIQPLPHHPNKNIRDSIPLQSIQTESYIGPPPPLQQQNQKNRQNVHKNQVHDSHRPPVIPFNNIQKDRGHQETRLSNSKNILSNSFLHPPPLKPQVNFHQEHQFRHKPSSPNVPNIPFIQSNDHHHPQPQINHHKSKQQPQQLFNHYQQQQLQIIPVPAIPAQSHPNVPPLKQDTLFEIQRIPEVFSTDLPPIHVLEYPIEPSLQAQVPHPSTFLPLPEIQQSTGQSLLVDIQPSQIANVIIPHGSTTALIYGGANELHKNGQYFDEPSPYIDADINLFYTNKPNKTNSNVINVDAPHNHQNTHVNIQPHRPIAANHEINMNANVLSQDVDLHAPPIKFTLKEENYAQHPSVNLNQHVDFNGVNTHIEHEVEIDNVVSSSIHKNEHRPVLAQGSTSTTPSDLTDLFNQQSNYVVPHYNGQDFNRQPNTYNYYSQNNGEPNQININEHIIHNGSYVSNNIQNGNNYYHKNSPNVIEYNGPPPSRQRQRPNVAPLNEVNTKSQTPPFYHQYYPQQHVNRPSGTNTFFHSNVPQQSQSNRPTPGRIVNYEQPPQVHQKPVYINLHEHVDTHVTQPSNAPSVEDVIVDEHKDDDLENEEGEVIQESNSVPVVPGQRPKDVFNVEVPTSSPKTMFYEIHHPSSYGDNRVINTQTESNQIWNVSDINNVNTGIIGNKKPIRYPTAPPAILINELSPNNLYLSTTVPPINKNRQEYGNHQEYGNGQEYGNRHEYGNHRRPTVPVRPLESPPLHPHGSSTAVIYGGTNDVAAPERPLENPPLHPHGSSTAIIYGGTKDVAAPARPLENPALHPHGSSTSIIYGGTKDVAAPARPLENPPMHPHVSSAIIIGGTKGVYSGVTSNGNVHEPRPSLQPPPRPAPERKPINLPRPSLEPPTQRPSTNPFVVSKNTIGFSKNRLQISMPIDTTGLDFLPSLGQTEKPFNPQYTSTAKGNPFVTRIPTSFTTVRQTTTMSSTLSSKTTTTSTTPLPSTSPEPTTTKATVRRPVEKIRFGTQTTQNTVSKVEISLNTGEITTKKPIENYVTTDESEPSGGIFHVQESINPHNFAFVNEEKLPNRIHHHRFDAQDDKAKHQQDNLKLNYPEPSADMMPPPPTKYHENIVPTSTEEVMGLNPPPLPTNDVISQGGIKSSTLLPPYTQISNATTQNGFRPTNRPYRYENVYRTPQRTETTTIRTRTRGTTNQPYQPVTRGTLKPIPLLEQSETNSDLSVQKPPRIYENRRRPDIRPTPSVTTPKNSIISPQVNDDKPDHQNQTNTRRYEGHNRQYTQLNTKYRLPSEILILGTEQSFNEDQTSSSSTTSLPTRRTQILTKDEYKTILSTPISTERTTGTTVVETPNDSVIDQPANSDTTSSLLKTKSPLVILPTRYITNTKTLTVTTTKTTVIRSQGITTTLTLTLTKTSTIIDTITHQITHTLVQPTIVTTSLMPEDKIVATSTVQEVPVFSHYPSFPGQSNLNYGDNAEHHPTFLEDEANLDEFIINYDEEIKVKKSSKPHQQQNVSQANENESIFVVMTDQKQPSTININPSMIDKPHRINAMSDNDKLNEIEDSGDSNNDDVVNRDEDDMTKDVNNVLLGGILIASPPRSDTPKMFNTNECRPDCKASRNELCQKIEGQMKCVCRPGFARMFPDRPCKPTYTYTISLPLVRHGSEKLTFEEALTKNTSPKYTHLSQVVHDGLDRMVMQSDLRDIYHGVHLIEFRNSSAHSHPELDQQADGSGLTSVFYLQLSDNYDDMRLLDIFHKYLRNNNYSLGGTDLYSSNALIDDMTATDFDECVNFNTKFNDCSEDAHCFNLRGTYTCSCKEGFADLSGNPIFPGRICSAELIGCEKCNYHGTCYSRGDDQMLCECFQWYAGNNCHVNLKVMLIALITVGLILFLLLLICLIMTCCKRKRPNNRTLVGMGLVSNKLVTNQRTMDRRAMIQETSSETSDDTHTLPYDRNKQNQLNKSQQSRSNLSLNNKFTIATQNSSAGHSGTLGMEQKDRSLTVMIPRAKYHPAAPPPPPIVVATTRYNMDSAPSVCSTTEAKLLSYLDASPTATTDHPRKKSTTNPLNKHGALNTTSTGALISAGFEVSATVGTENDLFEKIWLYNKLKSDEPGFQQLQEKSIKSDDVDSRHLDAKTEVASTITGNGEKVLMSPMGEWMDIDTHNEMTMSEARSYYETTIQPSTKTFRHTAGSNKAPSRNNEEANTMAERDLGSTFLLPHTHLYKPDRGSDISGFDSL